jgi:hypothetical protein
MTRGLADDVPALQAEVSRLGVGLVIVDSLAPACGAGPKARMPQSGASMHSAPRPSHAPGHRPRGKAGADLRTGSARPFGSVFVQNLARSVWELRRVTRLTATI